MPSLTNSFLAEGRSGKAELLGLAGFGKHPAWAEHIGDLGSFSRSLATARSLLFDEGIVRHLEAWEALPVGRQVAFGHNFVWLRGQETIVGRIVPSRDLVGRDQFPFIVAAHVALGVEATLEAAQPVLAWLGQFQDNAMKLSNREAVRGLFPERAAELAEQIQTAAFENSVLMDGAARQAWAAGLLGENSVGWVRLRAELESEDWARFRAGRGGKPGEWAARSGLLRVPLGNESALRDMAAWGQLTGAHLHAAVPKLWLVPFVGGWVDLIVGAPTPDDLYGLRANATQQVLSTLVSHPEEAQGREAALQELGQWSETGRVTPAPATSVSGERVVPVKDSARPEIGSGARGGAFPRKWVGLAAGAAVALAVFFLIPRANPEDWRKEAKAALARSDFAGALREYERILAKLPGDEEARRELAAIREAPSLDKAGEFSVEAGQKIQLQLTPKDAKGRKVSLSLTAGTEPKLGRLDSTNWTYAAKPDGNGREELRVRLDNGFTNVEVPLVVLVRPDANQRWQKEAEDAWTAGDYKTALERYRSLVSNGRGEEPIRSRIAQIETPASLKAPAAGTVVAGSRLPLAVEANDTLNRPLKWTFKPVKSPALGRLEESGGKVTYSARSDAEGEDRWQIEADNGFAPAQVEWRVMVTPTPQQQLARLKLQAEEAWKKLDYGGAEPLLVKLDQLAPKGEAAKRLAELRRAPELDDVVPIEVEAGAKVLLQPKTKDSLGRPVKVESGSRSPRLGQVSRTGGQLEYVARAGVAGDDKVELRLDNGFTNTVVLLAVKVVPSQVERSSQLAEEAFAKNDYATAKRLWERLISQGVVVGKQVEERLVQLNTPPAPAGEWNYTVVAGETVELKLPLARDPLERPVTKKVLKEPAQGKLAADSTGVWRFTAAADASGPDGAAFVLDNGTAASTNEVRLLVTAKTVVAGTAVVTGTGALQTATDTPPFDPLPEQLAEWLKTKFSWVPGPIDQRGWGPYPGQKDKGIWVARHEVWQGLYQEVMKTNPSAHVPGFQGPGFVGSPKLPVSQLTPADVNEFLRRVNERYAKQLPEDWRFQLPTKEQWQHFAGAAAGTSTKPISKEVVWNRAFPEEVNRGGAGKNEFGLEHVVGNIAEIARFRDSDVVFVLLGMDYHTEKIPNRIVAALNRLTAPIDEPQAHVGFRIILGPSGIGNP